MEKSHKKMKFDMDKWKDILKKITIDKWLLMGAAGIVLILCSDSCSTNTTKDNDTGYSLSDIQNGDDSSAKDGGNIVSSYAGAGVNSINMDSYVSSLEDKLENILMSVEGAGKVQVMITVKGSATKEVLMEEPYEEKNETKDDGAGGRSDLNEKSHGENVVYTENDSGTSPFVIAEELPQVEGVAVVAQGGENISVKEKITSIIKALFDIEINKIAVGKMK